MNRSAEVMVTVEDNLRSIKITVVGLEYKPTLHMYPPRGLVDHH